MGWIKPENHLTLLSLSRAGASACGPSGFFSRPDGSVRRADGSARKSDNSEVGQMVQ